MADVKTHLRELSVAVSAGLLIRGIHFRREDLYHSRMFLDYARQVVSGDLTAADNLLNVPVFDGELRQILDNGYRLAQEIVHHPHFRIPRNAVITWQGNDNHRDDPVDVIIGGYGFSLKEESFILENMGLYKLLNCYTGSRYRRRHIFTDYARAEYCHWFAVTWDRMLAYLRANNGNWRFYDPVRDKDIMIRMDQDRIRLEYRLRGALVASASLPVMCTLDHYERQTSSKVREQVFARFINQHLSNDPYYNAAKIHCAEVATANLATELNRNLNYRAGLPRFLRIHAHEYYYAKTTAVGVQILRVPSIDRFGQDIFIEAIEASVPNSQANILTRIRNRNTGRVLVIRNECRFSHGQFNGTPEAKMYYVHGGSLDVIYEAI